MSQFYKDSIFWIEVDKIKPNPFQPRREFDQAQLQSLADSIRQYGVLQALVVTRKEVVKDDGLVVEYELIAGERRLRASKLAGLSVVPCLIKDGEQDDRMKLELAIIENLQREDLNVVDRAIAFKRLSEEFRFTQKEIAEKVGKSRVYVTNTIRVLNLPQEMIDALKEGKMSEGHTRPLLMLDTRPAEQMTMFREIITRRISVREAELNARKIAMERSKIKGDKLDLQTREIEDSLTETLGTRVMIEKKNEVPGGKITITFFSDDDLRNILIKLRAPKEPELTQNVAEGELKTTDQSTEPTIAEDDRSKDEIIKAEETESDEDLYSLKNFSI